MVAYMRIAFCETQVALGLYRNVRLGQPMVAYDWMHQMHSN